MSTAEPTTTQQEQACFDALVKGMIANGCAVLDALVEPSLVVAAREAFLAKYQRFLQEQEHADALTVGGRRYMITVELEAPFSDEQFIANPKLLPILKALLGQDCVLANFGVVCSLPGAAAQKMHSDGGDLFPETPLDALLPAAAVTVAIPLLEMNAHHGTTALCPGTHRRRGAELACEPLEPVVQEGSALIWDYRLRHAGTANQSQRARPLIYATYCRAWFVDNHNFTKQSHFSIRPATYAALPEESRRLLSRAAPRA